VSHLIRIEQALAAIDDAAFQRLCDVLLRARGYDRINSIGTVLGANKVVTGTPDTLVMLPDGQFVFAEYTTQQSGTFGKLHSDLQKCFNEAKTGIPVARIHEIILCHNAHLTAKQEKDLVDECKQRGVGCVILGPNTIALDLYWHYPTIARDTFGIEVDTGQILHRNEFVRQYNRSHISPPIDTAFRFRTSEIDQALKSLEDSPLLILAGPAGVGKTRFALECADRFVARKTGVIVHCIYNRGLHIYEDIRAHLGPPGRYLIIVDDANRITGLRHVLDVLGDNGAGREAKIICTVRDYALEKVISAARPYGTYQCLKLEPFSKDEIRDLVRDGCFIQNQIYLDRIVEIANGNPRLALMAASTAPTKGSLEAINDASNLYDAYFDSIRSDIDALDNKIVLTVAGILAFFRVVDRANHELMALIEKEFGITANAFWDATMQLHDLELADVYENTVVKLNDQVLATYLFYLAFFKKRLLPFDVLLDRLFLPFRNRLSDALNPVAQTFHREALREEIQAHVVRAWDAFAARGDNVALLEFIVMFAQVRPTDALLFVKKQLDELTTTPNDNPSSLLEMSTDSDVKPESLLRVLGAFRRSNESDLAMALELLFDYLEKVPAHRERVARILCEDFGIDVYSFTRGYYREHAVVELLAKRAQDGKNALLSELFLTVAEKYLHVEFHKTTADRSRTIQMTRFAVVWTPELESLRKRIWETAFRLITEHQPQVLRMLIECGRSGHWFGTDDGTAKDAPTVLALIANHLDPSNLAHCASVQAYLNILDEHQVKYDESIGRRFRCEALPIFDALTGSSLERVELEWQKRHEQWQAGIRALVADYDSNAYTQLLHTCNEVRAAKIAKPHGFKIEAGAAEALLIAASDTPQVFAKVMQAYLNAGNFLKLGPSSLVYELSRILGTVATFQLLTHATYERKQEWLFAFLQHLSREDVCREHLDAVCTLYTVATVDELPRQWDFLNEFVSIDPQIVCRVTKILVDRAESECEIARALAPLFRLNAESHAIGGFCEFLRNDLALLRQAYLTFIANVGNADHDGTIFIEFLNCDPGFIEAYVEWIFVRDENRRATLCERDYDVLWKRDDHATIAKRMIELMYTEVRSRDLRWHSYPGRLFWVNVWDENPDPLVQARQDRLLTQMLRERQDDPIFVAVAFGIVCRFSNERRLAYIKILAEIKYPFDRFRELELQRSDWSWEGSQVPVLQERMAFWQEAGALFGGIDLLQHKKFIEECLEHALQRVVEAKREEFMED